MKKTVVSVIILFALSAQAFGQDIDNVLSRLAKHENVDKISIGSFGMFLAKMVGGAAGGKEAWQGLKGVKSFELLALSDECSAGEKAKIREQLKNLKDDKEYATLMNIKAENNIVRFLIKQKKDTIKEVLMVVLEEENTVVIRLKGSFKESDLATLVEKSSKKGNGQ